MVPAKMSKDDFISKIKQKVEAIGGKYNLSKEMANNEGGVCAGLCRIFLNLAMAGMSFEEIIKRLVEIPRSQMQGEHRQANLRISIEQHPLYITLVKLVEQAVEQGVLVKPKMHSDIYKWLSEKYYEHKSLGQLFSLQEIMSNVVHEMQKCNLLKYSELAKLYCDAIMLCCIDIHDRLSFVGYKIYVPDSPGINIVRGINELFKPGWMNVAIWFEDEESGHAIAVAKDGGGNVMIYDPNIGVVNLPKGTDNIIAEVVGCFIEMIKLRRSIKSIEIKFLSNSLEIEAELAELLPKIDEICSLRKGRLTEFQKKIAASEKVNDEQASLVVSDLNAMCNKLIVNTGIDQDIVWMLMIGKFETLISTSYLTDKIDKSLYMVIEMIRDLKKQLPPWMLNAEELYIDNMLLSKCYDVWNEIGKDTKINIEDIWGIAFEEFVKTLDALDFIKPPITFSSEYMGQLINGSFMVIVNMVKELKGSITPTLLNDKNFDYIKSRLFEKCYEIKGHLDGINIKVDIKNIWTTILDKIEPLNSIDPLMPLSDIDALISRSLELTWNSIVEQKKQNIQLLSSSILQQLKFNPIICGIIKELSGKKALTELSEFKKIVSVLKDEEAVYALQNLAVKLNSYGMGRKLIWNNVELEFARLLTQYCEMNKLLPKQDIIDKSILQVMEEVNCLYKMMGCFNRSKVEWLTDGEFSQLKICLAERCLEIKTKNPNASIEDIWKIATKGFIDLHYQEVYSEKLSIRMCVEKAVNKIKNEIERLTSEKFIDIMRNQRDESQSNAETYRFVSM